MTSWLSTAEDRIAEVSESCPGCSRALALRLSHLLLQRLGDPLAPLIVDLLPEHEQSLFAGLLLELDVGDSTIGYPQFLEHASSLFPQAGVPEVVDAFLSGVAAGLPEHPASMVAGALPLELRRPFTSVPTHPLRAA